MRACTIEDVRRYGALAVTAFWPFLFSIPRTTRSVLRWAPRWEEACIKYQIASTLLFVVLVDALGVAAPLRIFGDSYHFDSEWWSRKCLRLRVGA